MSPDSRLVRRLNRRFRGWTTKVTIGCGHGRQGNLARPRISGAGRWTAAPATLPRVGSEAPAEPSAGATSTRDADQMAELFDVAVEAGSAGAVIAARRSEAPSVRVA
jgi:hypothetical protein